MDSFQTFILLMFAASIIVGISQKLNIPYPIGLVLGGAALGFNPHQSPINFDPHLLLVIVLPPILYYAAFEISLREFKNNWKDILSLAVGLVTFTTLLAGVLFKWMFPQFPWALAFTFGAIVSPPDAIAATSILKRFSISNRLMTVLEGESLVNDASALVLYKMGIIALLSGAFSLAEGSIHFVTEVSGGILLGVVVGFIVQRFSRHFLEPVVGVVFSFTIPYITYILAYSLGVSGVLAVVANGLVGSQILIRHHSSLRRVLGFAAWDIFIILMNCFVFILIGTQLQPLMKEMTFEQLLQYSSFAFVITVAMIILRTLWAYAKSIFAYIKALNKPRAEIICPQILKEAGLIGWTGMRGIVSLTAALAIPYTGLNGLPIEGRNEVILLTFMVILLTLLIPGLTLSSLICWLKIPSHPQHHITLKVKKLLTENAEQTIQQLHKANEIDDNQFTFLNSYFNLKLQLVEIADPTANKKHNLESARKMILQEQRKELFKIWERLEIDDKLLSQLEQELDLEETHLARAQLK